MSEQKGSIHGGVTHIEFSHAARAAPKGYRPGRPRSGMTENELVKELAGRIPLSQSETWMMLHRLFYKVINLLVEYDTVDIGFLRFKKHHRKGKPSMVKKLFGKMFYINAQMRRNTITIQCKVALEGDDGQPIEVD